MNKEIWKNIPRFDKRYEVSNHGNLRFGDKEVDLQEGHKYIYANIRYKGGHKTLVKVDRLVLRAFVGEPTEEKFMSLHKDDNGYNNHLSNLYWGDHKDNYWDKRRNKKLEILNELTAEKLKEYFKNRPAIINTKFAESCSISRRTINYILNEDRNLTNEVKSKMLPVMRKYGYEVNMRGTHLKLKTLLNTPLEAKASA